MKVKFPKSPSDTFNLELRPEMPFDALGFGTNSVDHICMVPQYPQYDTKTEILQYAMLSGGQTATAITFLAHMGLKAKYIGKVGDDELGRFSLRSFRSESIDVSSVIVEKDASNQFAVIVIDQRTGERTILWQRDPKLDFGGKELRREAICTGLILLLDGYDSAAVQVASWCRESGIAVVADLDRVVPKCAQLIEKTDFLIVSSNFPSEFTGVSDPLKAFEELHDKFAGFLAVTLGERGAMASVGNQCITFPGINVHPLDTTGAGDIFHGGFIYGLLQNWPLEKIMAFANAAAGLSCRHLGARAGIRPLSEILKYI
jgi:sulfofructose kinase